MGWTADAGARALWAAHPVSTDANARHSVGREIACATHLLYHQRRAVRVVTSQARSIAGDHIKHGLLHGPVRALQAVPKLHARAGRTGLRKVGQGSGRRSARDRESVVS